MRDAGLGMGEKLHMLHGLRYSIYSESLQAGGFNWPTGRSVDSKVVDILRVGKCALTQ